MKTDLLTLIGLLLALVGLLLCTSEYLGGLSNAPGSAGKAVNAAWGGVTFVAGLLMMRPWRKRS
jgi:hypothetical protein